MSRQVFPARTPVGDGAPGGWYAAVRAVCCAVVVAALGIGFVLALSLLPS